jgi:hypothetical protein
VNVDSYGRLGPERNYSELQLCRYTVSTDVSSSLCIIYLWTTMTVPSGLSRQASA